MTPPHDSPKSKTDSGQLLEPPALTPSSRKESEPYTLLFFSVDVAGSTHLKNALPLSAWMELFTQFYRDAVLAHLQVEAEHSEYISKSNIPWKCIGDEAISWYRLNSNDPNRVCEAVCKIIPSFLKATLNLDKMIVNDAREASPGLRVGVKGAAWLALIDEENNTEIELPPQQYTSNEDTTSQKDFLGQHIDEGFRITGCTESRRLALSFDLARLLSQNTATANRMHLISYQNFRGIWRDRYYPIIWYDEERTNFEGSIIYDEWFRSSLLCDYDKRRHPPMPSSDLEKHLETIRKDVEPDAGLNGKDWPWTESRKGPVSDTVR